MNDQFKQMLTSQGVDIKKTLERFLNKEDLYEKFLLKYLNEPHFDALKQQLANKEYEEAYKSAHTLKGVSANLGLPIDDILVKMLDCMKKEKTEDLDQIFEELEEKFTAITDVIRSNSI